MLLLSCIIFSILTLFNYYIAGKRLTYPAFIFCAFWLFLFLFRIIFTQFYLKDIYEVNVGTYILFISGGLVATVAGYLILLQNSVHDYYRSQMEAVSTEKFLNLNNTYLIRFIFLIASILIFPFYVRYIASIVVASEVENIFKSIRYETAVAGQSFGIYGYVITFVSFLSLVNGYSYWQDTTKRNKYIYILSIVIALIYAACTMGRSPILTVIAFNIGIYLISNQKIKFASLVRYALLFPILFIIMGVLLDKGGGLNASFFENADSGFETFGLYIISPMNAINEVLYGNYELTHGAKTFRFFYVFLNSIDIVNIRLDEFNLVDEFLFVPYPVNVYTFYNPYVRDFGVLFSLFSLFFFISWHCWAFVRSIRVPHCYFPKLTYSFLFYPLIMTIFNDQYASLFSTWIQLYFFAALYYGLIYLLRNVKVLSKSRSYA